jgi:hypothetical protein
MTGLAGRHVEDAGILVTRGYDQSFGRAKSWGADTR